MYIVIDFELDKYTITKGDLLICEGGDIGRSAIWNFDEPMRIQNHIHRLRFYVPLETELYLFYVISLQSYWDYCWQWYRIARIVIKQIAFHSCSITAFGRTKVIVQKIKGLLNSLDNIEQSLN